METAYAATAARAKEEQVDLRTAAYRLAIERVHTAQQLRGV